MPINFPTLKNLVDRTRSDVRNELPNSDPTIFGSFLRAITTSLANRAYDVVLLIRQALDQSFPQTANDIYLQRFAGYEGLVLNDATNSNGIAVYTGVVGATIPVSTQVNSPDGLTFTTQVAVSVTSKSVSVTELVRSGSTVTATTSTSHNLASGLTATISGAIETDYNGDYVVTVTGLNTFQYEVTGTPSTPATGTVLVGIDSAVVSLQSDETGKVQNIGNGSLLTLNTTINGVDSVGYASFDGMSGGSDLETDDELRSRVLFSRSNPVSHFNEASIKNQVDSVAGVTRSFVREITPNVGDVTVYFFRDNDVNPIPTSSQLATVKDKILEDLPATSDASNVYVLAPNIVNTDFTFTSITPNTPTMQIAVEANLQAFFDDKAEFETNVTQDKYRCAIQETQDTATGEFLQSFVLSSPSDDIVISSGEIAGLGSVNF